MRSGFGSLRPHGLAVVALAAAAVSVVQWIELVEVQSGQEAFCSVSTGLDCATVWAAPLAKRIHAVTRVPVAGWGLVWALGALLSSLAVLFARRGGRPEKRSDATAVAVVRTFALAGAIGAVAFMALSLTTGALCLTCIATYVLVGIFGAWAWGLRPANGASAGAWMRPLAVSLALVTVLYLAVLGPGMRTPVEPVGQVFAESSAGEPSRPGQGSSLLRQFLSQLPAETRQALWTALVEYRNEPTVGGAKFGVRHVVGSDAAPTHIVEFSDILCSHCARLNEAMREIRRRAPADSFRSESRFFPIDVACNPKVPPHNTDGTGTRCTGARVLICLEQDEAYASVRSRLFREQRLLDVERIFRIAVDGSSLTKDALTACVESPETEQKLQADIAYAWQYHLRGTPLVVVNGKKSASAVPFLFALILAGGDPHHPAFQLLEPSS